MTEPIKISTYSKPLPPDDGPQRYLVSSKPFPKSEGIRLLFIPLLVLAFVGGLFVGAKIDGDKPTVNDPGFVNIEDHEGEILVVRGNSVEWTTEAALHEKAGHG